MRVFHAAKSAYVGVGWLYMNTYEIGEVFDMANGWVIYFLMINLPKQIFYY